MTGEVRLLEPSEFALWDDFVCSSEHGSVYSLSSYLAVLAKAAGQRVKVAAVINNGRIAAGIAYTERSTRWGDIVEPRLLLQYNGPVIASAASTYPSKQTANELALSEKIAVFLESQQYGRTVIKCRWPYYDVRAFLARGWRAVPAYTYMVDLGDMNAAWGSVDRNLKRLINRCRTDGYTVQRSDEFDDFFRMHLETHERKGAPIYLPKSEFEAYFRELKELGLARLYYASNPSGNRIAAQLVLAGKCSKTETVSAAAEGSELGSGASAFLRWSVFEELSREGFRYNDLTDASLNSVTRFKSQFGGELRICFALIFPSTRSYRIGSSLSAAVRRLLRR